MLPIFALGFFLAAGSEGRAQQPAAGASTNAATAVAPLSYPAPDDLTDAQLAKELTDIGGIVKTEGDAPDGAIVEITFTYTHKQTLSPSGKEVPDYPLTDDLLARISKLPKLTHLELNMCQSLTSAGLANLKGMTQLQALALPHRIVTDADMANLAGLTNLTFFRGSGAKKLTSAGWAVIQNWKQLEGLWVEEGTFNDEAMPYLKGLTHLKEVRFDSDAISDTGEDVLLGLPNLTHIRRGLLGSKEEAAKLRAALPNCNIDR